MFVQEQPADGFLIKQEKDTVSVYISFCLRNHDFSELEKEKAQKPIYSVSVPCYNMNASWGQKKI